MQARLRGLGRPQALSTGLIGACLCHQVTADVSSDPRGRRLDGIPREVGIAGGRLHLGVAQELPDHGKAFAESQGTGGKGMAQVMNSDVLKGAVTVTGWCQLRVASSFLL